MFAQRFVWRLVTHTMRSSIYFSQVSESHVWVKNKLNKPQSHINSKNYTIPNCGAWWHIGRFAAFRPKSGGVRIPLLSPRRDLGQVLHSQLPVALRRETPTQYPCCVRSASE